VGFSIGLIYIDVFITYRGCSKAPLTNPLMPPSMNLDIVLFSGVDCGFVIFVNPVIYLADVFLDYSNV
jgi:hypothetical protein